MTHFLLLGAAIYAIVGGPSVGKSSIINELKKDGEKTCAEAATLIIKERLKNGQKEPWLAVNFQKDVFNMQLAKEQEADMLSNGPVFIDRGILDNLVYLRHRNRIDSEEYKYIEQKVKESNPKTRYAAVFFVEPHSKQSFTSTKEDYRAEDTAEALVISRALKEAYSKHYNLITVPGGLTPKERATFIKNKISRL